MLSTIRHKAFTLVETLVSIMIVGSILTVMYSGFDISKQQQMQADFESEASIISEREMEYIKSELIDGKIKPKSTKKNGSFKVPAGWQVTSTLGEYSSDKTMKITVETSKNNNKFMLSSYIYIPNNGVTK